MPLLLLAAVVVAALPRLPACAQAYAVPPNDGTPEVADVTVDIPAANVSLVAIFLPWRHCSPRASEPCLDATYCHRLCDRLTAPHIAAAFVICAHLRFFYLSSWHSATAPTDCSVC